MDAWCRGCCRLAIALSLLQAGAFIGAPLGAASVVTVFPGMEIHQGSAVCTLGMVETQLRIAVTTGQCDGDPIVSDNSGNAVGVVLLSRRNSGDGAPVDSTMVSVEYEVIKLAPEVKVSDLLPTGRQLQGDPGLRAQPPLPVCHFGIGSGQSCGRVSAEGNGRFVITSVSVDKRDVGGPVYTLTDDNRALIVGLLDGESISGAEAESWQAIMRQLYIDLRSQNSPQPLPSEVRTISHHRAA